MWREERTLGWEEKDKSSDLKWRNEFFFLLITALFEALFVRLTQLLHTDYWCWFYSVKIKGNNFFFFFNLTDSVASINIGLLLFVFRSLQIFFFYLQTLFVLRYVEFILTIFHHHQHCLWRFAFHGWIFLISKPSNLMIFLRSTMQWKVDVLRKLCS